MSKIKRALSFALGTVMAISMVIPAAAYKIADDVQGTPYEEAATVLGALGIMVGDDVGTFRPDDAISRAEFSKIAVHALGIESIASANQGVSIFPDVTTDHWANGYINIASSQGIIVGDDTGTFRPDDKISYQEAVTILIRVLGHEPAAISKGGYPTGYLVQGGQIGVTKDVNAVSTSDATRGMVAQMTFNSLTIDLMEQTGFGNDVKYEIVDKTLLEDKLEVFTETGIITGNSETRISNSNGLKKGQIEIGEGKVFKEGVSEASKLLGFEVDYYYKENKSEKELILANPTNKNEAIDIKAENLAEELNEGATTISYYEKEDDNKAQKVELSEGYNVIYNKKHQANLVNPATGVVSVLDNDSDGFFDIVFIDEHKNYVVDSTSAFSKKVYDKYDQEPLSLDTEANRDLTVLISDSQGNEMKFEDLKEWDVLSVYKNNNYVNIIVHRETVKGVITETTGKGNKVIGEKEFEVAGNLNANDLELGMDGIFYLDFQGNIAGYDATARETANYGYLLNAAISQGLNPVLSVKIYDANGKEVVYDAPDKIKFNGEYGVAKETVLEGLKSGGTVTPQLVTYELNSQGKLAELDIAADKTASFPTSFLKSDFALNFKGNDLEFKSASNKLNILDDSGKITGSIGVNSSTIVFDIPQGETDTDKMAVRNTDMFSDKATYNVLAYDMTEDHVATAIIVTNSTNVEKLESPIAIVDQIATVKNDENVTTDKLYAFVDGEKKEFMAENTSVLKKGANKLQTGDIIQFTTNAKGEIEGITVLFDASQKATEFSKVFGDNNEMETIYGKVTKKFQDSVNITVSGGKEMNYKTGDATVYRFDSTKTKNQLSLANAEDITKWEDTANEVRVFIRIYKDQVQEIVIVE